MTHHTGSDEGLSEAERKVLRQRIPLNENDMPHVYGAVSQILAARAAAPDRGICGDRFSPLISPGDERRTSVCMLLADHAGWHHGVDGSDWSRAAAPDALRERVEALAAEWEQWSWHFTDIRKPVYASHAKLLRAALGDPTDGAGT